MIEHRKTRRRRFVIDFLEDRAVPSTGASSVHIAATNSTGSTGSTSNQDLSTELTQIGDRVNAAYASFATAIRQAEVTFYAATIGAGTGGSTTTTPVTTTALASQVTQQIGTLSQALTAAVATLPGGTGRLSNLLQAELSATSPGSLSGQMTRLLAAASAGTTDGSVPQASLPFLFGAVDSAISMSYTTTAVNTYYYAAGQSGSGSTSTGTSGSGTTGGNSSTAFDLSTVATQQNAAYASFATAVRQAELTLVTPTGTTGTTTATGTPATVKATVTQQINTLSQALTSALSSSAAASKTGPLEASLTGSQPGSLSSVIDGLLTTAGASGTVPQASLPLLFTAVDNAIEASYSATAVDNYLLATSPIFLESGTGTGTGSTGTGTGTTGTTTGSKDSG